MRASIVADPVLRGTAPPSHDDDGPHVRSDGIEVMARPARMTSKGMRAVPSEGPIDALFASP